MARGRLRIYLGAAPGVGKTFAMLNEGRRRHDRGTDVIVGLVETHGRGNTASQIGDLDVIPRKKVTYRGSDFEEMDTEAIIARKPDQTLVDELAHTNVPGSKNEKRWQDVDEILDAGIDVISTLNIQHLESLNDVVERITGITQHETIPDAIVRAAEQVELVDMTPEALRRRMAHGNIYPAERVDAALANYFRPGNLGALRELALLWVADKVDESLHDYMEIHGIESTWETRERVVVAITGAPNGENLIRRAARMAQRAHGDLLGVHVRSSDGLRSDEAGPLDDYRKLLEGLGGTYHEVMGDDAGAALLQFARSEHATQLVVGASERSRWAELVRGSVISRVIRRSGPIDVHVISSEQVEVPERRRPTRSVPVVVPGLPRRRELTGWLLALVALPLVTLAMAQVRGQISLPSNLLIYLLVVVAVAFVGGVRPALAAGAASFLLANWYFTPPLYEWTIKEAEDLLALLVFLAVGVLVSMLVTSVARRSLEAARAKAEAEALARLSGSLIGETDPLGVLMTSLRESFGVAACAVLRREGPGWRVETSSGEPIPARPEDGDLSVTLDDDEVLVLAGGGLPHEDLVLLQAFTGQLALAMESTQLRAEAALATGLHEANELRAALLAAVSHDLRTPLSSIKASVTSLLQHDVDWTPAATKEFLQTIDEEADRLDALVGNLLDMSRLQSGVLQLVMRDVGLDEVVPAAIAGLGERATALDVRVDENLPRVHADAALLERAIANIVDNALAWSSDSVVVVEAGAIADRVDLRIVDRGPGIPVDQRDKVFEPFQRLGDRSNGSGVGLGLAVAKGFVEAMGGTITVDDTPGGGLTMVISLHAAA